MKATENIWREYHRKLETFIRNRVSEEVSDDLLQDVFLKFHARLESLEDDARLESWLYQVTRNTVIDYYRTGRATTDLPEWLEQPEPDEEESIRQELASCLEPMVNELPEKYRKAIQLSEIENKTQREVAESENLSLSGAKSRVQRGRALLREMLNDCCHIELNRNNQVLSYEKKDGNSDCC